MTSITINNDKDTTHLVKRDEERPVQMFHKVASAVFYALCSFLITVVNKSVLTSYEFPSYQVVALGQISTTIIVLFVCKQLNIVTFPSLTSNTFKDLSPLPFIYIGNMIFGLGGTKQLSLPMFTMLRRFSILMTMIAEFYILLVRPRLSVKISVGLMIIGAIIAALNDLGFNLEGYIFVLLSDVLTASSGVFTKKILSTRKEMGKNGILFYCALFMFPFSAALVYTTGDWEAAKNYNRWNELFFVIQFTLSCTMGFILNYSVILCTQYNSALTTTIIGCLKNVFVTYLGMFIGGDYIFSGYNFIGINLSVVGSLLYTYVTFKPQPQLRQTSTI